MYQNKHTYDMWWKRFQKRVGEKIIKWRPACKITFSLFFFLFFFLHHRITQKTHRLHRKWLSMHQSKRRNPRSLHREGSKRLPDKSNRHSWFVASGDHPLDRSASRVLPHRRERKHLHPLRLQPLQPIELAGLEWELRGPLRDLARNQQASAWLVREVTQLNYNETKALLETKSSPDNKQ